MDTRTDLLRRPPKLYEQLIRLYPTSYRRLHRDELLQNFEDLERDLGSRRLLWTFVINDLIKSLITEYMEYIRQHRWAQLALVAFVFFLIVGSLFAWQVLYLQRAHSTFDNYAAFRGCEEITSETPTTGTCIIGSGQSITIVKFDNRWFLQGDLPVCMIGIGSFCLADQP